MRLAARSSSVGARTGTAGRIRLTASGVRPERVGATIALAPRLAATNAAASERTRDWKRPVSAHAPGAGSSNMAPSARRAIFAIARTAVAGFLPTLVSSESMTASVPSQTAPATSVASARVGLDEETIDSIICVAVIAGLPAAAHSRSIILCRSGTWSKGISIPRSPRAIITASETSIISLKFSSASGFSIFATIPTWGARRLRTLRSEEMLERERTKESPT